MEKQVKRFEELLVWQKARELVKIIYKISDNWRDLSLKDQIRRASVSVMSNIAEGFERGTKDEVIYFMFVSRGSVGEVRSQLYVGYDLGLISREDFLVAYDLADFTARLIFKFIESYKKGSYGGQKFADKKFVEREEFNKYLETISGRKIN